MTTATAAAPELSPEIGGLLNDLRRVRDEKDRLNDLLKKQNEQETAIKAKLLDFHESTGLNVMGNEVIGVTFKHELRPRVDPEKWAAIFNWAAATGNTHICYRQLSGSKVIELMNSGVALPEGITIEGFTDLNIRRKNN